MPQLFSESTCRRFAFVVRKCEGKVNLPKVTKKKRELKSMIRFCEIEIEKEMFAKLMDNVPCAQTF